MIVIYYLFPQGKIISFYSMCLSPDGWVVDQMNFARLESTSPTMHGLDSHPLRLKQFFRRPVPELENLIGHAKARRSQRGKY